MRMSFFGDAFVHGVIPGIAAAVVLDLNPLVGAAIAAAVMVFAIELVNRHTVLVRTRRSGCYSSGCWLWVS